MFGLAKQFRFEAVHTLPGRAVDAEPSRRIHGHSCRAKVVVHRDSNAESCTYYGPGRSA